MKIFFRFKKKHWRQWMKCFIIWASRLQQQARIVEIQLNWNLYRNLRFTFVNRTSWCEEFRIFAALIENFPWIAICVDHMRVLNFISVDFCFVRNHLCSQQFWFQSYFLLAQLLRYFLHSQFAVAPFNKFIEVEKLFGIEQINIFLFIIFCNFLCIISISVWLFFVTTQPEDVSRLQLTYFGFMIQVLAPQALEIVTSLSFICQLKQNC